MCLYIYTQYQNFNFNLFRNTVPRHKQSDIIFDVFVYCVTVRFFNMLISCQFIFINRVEMSQEAIVLGYWGIRGRGQCLRHLLCYTGLQFQEKIYKSPQQYGDDIKNIGPFPNLPYLKDGDFTFSETLGIARYIVKRAGKPEMLGATPEDEGKMDNFIYAFDDLFAPLIALFFNKKVNDVKAGHYFKIKGQLEKFNKYIEEKQYVMGYITIADFLLAQYSHYIQRLYPEEFNKYGNILNVRNTIQNLPEVKAYYDRPDAVLTPFLPPNKTTFPFYWPGTEPLKPLNIKPSQGKKPQPKKVQQVSQQAAEDEEFYTPQYPHRVVVMSGSISANASGTYFLQLITGMQHPAFQFQWCDIASLQVHSEDYQEYGADNANVLRGQVYQAEAILICVAETHGLVTTVLTNAFNWLVSVLKQKPVAVISIQSSEEQFRKALDFQGINYLKDVKLQVQDPTTYYDENGGLTVESYGEVRRFLNRFAKFIENGS